MQITRYRGDIYADEILISKSGEVIDLTGCTVVMTLNSVRNPVDITTQIYQLTGVINISTGVVSFSPNSVQADRVGLFYYDIQITDSQSNKITVMKDVYVYEQDITKN